MTSDHIEGQLRFILAAIESSPTGLSSASLLQKAGLKQSDLTQVLSQLASLGLIREDSNGSNPETLWIDRSKFFTQKLIDFNPAMLEFNLADPVRSPCHLLPSHKRDIVQAISSIPFFFERDFSNPQRVSDEDPAFYAFKRSFETSLYEGVFEANNDSRYLDSAHCCARSLFRSLSSITESRKISIQDLARINALFDDEYNPARDGSVFSPLRSAPSTFKDSLYVPLKSAKSIEIFTHKLLNTGHKIRNPLDRAFYMNLNLMYLQPFTHANKRTAAVVANSGLLNSGLAPYTHSMHSKESFINAFLDYCEYADPEPMSHVFSQAVVQSSSLFERTFEEFHAVVRNLTPSEIRKISIGALKNILHDGLSPSDSIRNLLGKESDAVLTKIVRSEVSNLLWQLAQQDQKNDLLKESPELQRLYDDYTRAAQFDSLRTC